MIYRNAHIFDPEKGFVFGSFSVDNGIFTAIEEAVQTEISLAETVRAVSAETVRAAPAKTAEAVPAHAKTAPMETAQADMADFPEERDLNGAYVIPGLIDIHTHGNSGADFSDGIYEDDLRMGRFFAAHGVTSFCPASMTLPYDVLDRAFMAGKQIADNRPADCARLAGINMEGPFFSEKKKGAQNGEYLKTPDFEVFQRLYEHCGGLIRLVDLAPELPGAVEFTEKAKRLCTVSIAHTDAGYEDAAAVISAGATHLTHLFNAMPGIHHRKPGVIGAASEAENVTAELICDGFHVHPSAVRMAFRLFPDRICLISDSLRCTGMPDGFYPFAGQTVELKNNECRLPDGTIAGSIATLYQCMRNAIRFGIPVKTAINAASLIPAKEIGMADRIGSIETGKYADFVVCDSNLELREVYISGVRI